MTNRRMAALAALLAAGASATTLAQAPSPPGSGVPAGRPSGLPALPAPDPRMPAAQAAFEALPEAERRNIQDDLVWAGDYLGGLDGGFGRRSFEAILAFEARAGLTPDGALSPAERAALALAARRARAAAGFAPALDPRTGVRIGVPAALLPKRGEAPQGGSRWQSADDRVTLDTRIVPPDGGDLPALFERLSGGNAPGRRVTYRLLRPDFLVVSGETTGGRFYTRYAAGPEGIRGFSIGYDRALAPQFDRLAVAIANSFEPFPSGAQPAVAGAANHTAGAPPVQPADGSAAIATPPATPPSTPAERRGNAVALADGRALTSAGLVAGCRGLSVAGQSGAVLASDVGTGLALLSTAPRGAASLKLASGALAGGEPLLVLGYGGDVPGLAVSPGEASARAGERPGILAALQAGSAASPVLDRQGALVGLVAADPPSERRIAGLVPAMRHPLIPGANLARFAVQHNAPLGGVGAAGAPRTAGEIAAAAGPLVLPVVCRL